MSLPHLWNAVTVSDEMIRRRDTVKRLYGTSYERHVADAKRIVQGVMDRDKLGAIQAALSICKQAVLDGQGAAVNMVISAAVDLCEGK